MSLDTYELKVTWSLNVILLSYTCSLSTVNVPNTSRSAIDTASMRSGLSCTTTLCMKKSQSTSDLTTNLTTRSVNGGVVDFNTSTTTCANRLSDVCVTPYSVLLTYACVAVSSHRVVYKNVDVCVSPATTPKPASP